jgi:hypothetical protein
MNATLTAQAPKFHALTGTQPVGQKQVAVASDFAGTVTVVTRENESYWAVNVRSVVHAFDPAKREQGKTVTIWFDQREGRYVADYHTHGEYVEVDRTQSLQAAIGVASDAAAQRWAADREGLYR